MIEETKASRQREYDDVVAKSVRRRPRPSPPLNSPSATPASGLHPTLAEADRVSGWGRSNPATPRRPRRWRAPCSSRSPNFCPRRSRTSAHPSATQHSQALLLFLGRCFANVREQKVLLLPSVDAERGAVAAQGRGPEHAHTVRPGSQHHLPVNQKRFPGEACCVFRPGGSVPAAAMQTRFHERWGGSLYVSGAVGVCGWRGGRGVGRCDEGNAHPFLCRNTPARTLSGGDTKPLTNTQAISRVSKLSSTPRWKIRCRRPPLAFFCPRSWPCRFTRPQPPKCRALFWRDAK